jgi:hypothetical protein
MFSFGQMCKIVEPPVSYHRQSAKLLLEKTLNLFSEESILLAFPSVKTVLPPTTKDKDMKQINSFRHSKLLKKFRLYAILLFVAG